MGPNGVHVIGDAIPVKVMSNAFLSKLSARESQNIL